MIGFEHPAMLALALVAPALWLLFARRQRRSLAWVEAHVAPRFRRRLTVHGRRSLDAHLALLLVLGLLLAAAAAGPTLAGRVEVAGEGARVLLLIDASASMKAEDVGGLPRAPETPANRLEVARFLAGELVERLAASRFALVTFSGVATLQLPETADRGAIAAALAVFGEHTYYQNTGSSFEAALDAALRLAGEGADRRRGLQVVLLSDGEQPFPESYGAPLAALAERQVPVHAVAIGGTEGQGRVIYDFRDVVAGKDERRVLAEFTTRRVDEHLERMARATGGRFAVAAPGIAEELAGEIRRRGGAVDEIADERARRDLTKIPLALFLAGFLFETMLLGRRRRQGLPDFEIERLGEGGGQEGGDRRRHRERVALAAPFVLCFLLAASCGDSPLERAHHENEAGIALDQAGLHRRARRHYERARAFGVRPEIPTYNLARSLASDRDYSAAHDLYQEALRLDPGLAAAHHNDGWTLFLWGAAERDPRGCRLERTVELWRLSRRRFAAAVQRAERGSDLAAAARANAEAVTRHLAEVEMLIAEPPPECFEELEQERQHAPGGGRMGGPGRGGGGGGGESEAEQSEHRAAGGGEEEPQPAELGREGEPQPVGGAPPPEDPGGGSAGASPAGGRPQPAREPLTPAEQEEIAAALERIRSEAQEEGKFHRRTLAEQLPRQVWESPEREIWW